MKKFLLITILMLPFLGQAQVYTFDGDIELEDFKALQNPSLETHTVVWDSITKRLRFVKVKDLPTSGNSGAQNLQQVTDLGNETTSDISVIGNTKQIITRNSDNSSFARLNSFGHVSVKNVNSEDVGYLTSRGLVFTNPITGATSTINFDVSSSGGTYTLPAPIVPFDTIARKSDIKINASGFSNNLAVTDTTFQLVANKFDASNRGIENVIEDTSPELGGNLNTNGQLITDASGTVDNGLRVRGSSDDVLIQSTNGLGVNNYLRVLNDGSFVNYANFIGTGLSGRSDILIPNIGTTGRYMPFSVNGEFADSSGNINVSTGGSSNSNFNFGDELTTNYTITSADNGKLFDYAGTGTVVVTMPDNTALGLSDVEALGFNVTFDITGSGFIEILYSGSATGDVVKSDVDGFKSTFTLIQDSANNYRARGNCIAYTPVASLPSTIDIPELEAYFNEGSLDSSVTTDGTAVATWVDLKNSNDGVITGGVLNLNGSTRELEFDGSTSFVNLSQPTSMNPTPSTDEFTVMIQTGSITPTTGNFFAKAGSNSGNRQFALGINNSDFDFLPYVGGRTTVNNANTDLSSSKIIFLRATTTVMTTYVDGTAYNINLSGSNATNSADVLLGARRGTDSNTGTGYMYDGALRKFAYFSKALSDAEMDAIVTQIQNLEN